MRMAGRYKVGVSTSGREGKLPGLKKPERLNEHFQQESATKAKNSRDGRARRIGCIHRTHRNTKRFLYKPKAGVRHLRSADSACADNNGHKGWVNLGVGAKYGENKPRCGHHGHGGAAQGKAQGDGDDPGQNQGTDVNTGQHLLEYKAHAAVSNDLVKRSSRANNEHDGSQRGHTGLTEPPKLIPVEATAKAQHKIRHHRRDKQGNHWRTDEVHIGHV